MSYLYIFRKMALLIFIWNLLTSCLHFYAFGIFYIHQLTIFHLLLTQILVILSLFSLWLIKLFLFYLFLPYLTFSLLLNLRHLSGRRNIFNDLSRRTFIISSQWSMLISLKLWNSGFSKIIENWCTNAMTHMMLIIIWISLSFMKIWIYCSCLIYSVIIIGRLVFNSLDSKLVYHLLQNAYLFI